MAGILLDLAEPICDMLCCNPPIKHTHDDSQSLLDKTFTFGSPTHEDLSNKSGENLGDASKDFIIKNITSCDNLTITGKNVYVTGDIKLNSNVTIKATGTVVIQGVIQNYCKLNITGKELYCNNGLMNECILTTHVTDVVVIRGAETATGTKASLVNKCELYASFTKSGETFTPSAPAKTVVLEHKVINECKVRAFAEKLICKQDLINANVIDAFCKDYVLVGQTESNSMINNCVLNVHAYKYGGKSEQCQLVEVQGRLLNNCNVTANATLLWLNENIMNKCEVKYVAKVQHKCGMFFPWKRLGSTIVQDGGMTGTDLGDEATNPMQG